MAVRRYPLLYSEPPSGEHCVMRTSCHLPPNHRPALPPPPAHQLSSRHHRHRRHRRHRHHRHRPRCFPRPAAAGWRRAASRCRPASQRPRRAAEAGLRLDSCGRGTEGIFSITTATSRGGGGPAPRLLRRPMRPVGHGSGVFRHRLTMIHFRLTGWKFGAGPCGKNDGTEDAAAPREDFPRHQPQTTLDFRRSSYPAAPGRCSSSPSQPASKAEARSATKSEMLSAITVTPS